MAQPLIISSGQVQVAPTTEDVTFGTVTGAALVADDGSTAAFIELAAGSTAAVSAASEGRLRYNESTQKLQVSANAGGYVDLATGSGSAPAATIVTSASTFTTSSTGFVLVTGMTTTPAAGTYAVIATSNLRHSNKNGYADMTLYLGGTVVDSGIFQRSTGDSWKTATVIAKVTANGSQAIEMRVRRDTTAGNAEAARNKLMIIEVT